MRPYFGEEADKASTYQQALGERAAHLAEFICTDGVVEMRRSAYGVYTDEALLDETGKPTQRMMVAIDAQCPRGIRKNDQPTTPANSE
jgi:hypothetical protein